MNRWFARIASTAGAWTGHPLAFVLSATAVIVWAVSGPLFGYSDTWQLVINTATTILTFLLVFLIQNTQNRDSTALHLKLDEILRALPQARTELAVERLENATDEELVQQRQELDELARRAEPPGRPASAAEINEAGHEWR